jgi:hypothetical protein
MENAMKNSAINRRDFNKLTAAAMGGLVAGTVVGCGGGAKPPEPAPAPGDGTGAAKPAGGDEVVASLMMEEPHVCRGLNTCQSKGASGDNACAGQGACATAEKHDCHGMNMCKGQGGCGETAGQNGCKGKGNCAVPLSDEAWAKARKKFEELMSGASKQVGDAPAKSS